MLSGPISALVPCRGDIKEIRSKMFYNSNHLSTDCFVAKEKVDFDPDIRKVSQRKKEENNGRTLSVLGIKVAL